MKKLIMFLLLFMGLLPTSYDRFYFTMTNRCFAADPQTVEGPKLEFEICECEVCGETWFCEENPDENHCPNEEYCYQCNVWWHLPGPHLCDEEEDEEGDEDEEDGDKRIGGKPVVDSNQKRQKSDRKCQELEKDCVPTVISNMAGKNMGKKEKRELRKKIKKRIKEKDPDVNFRTVGVDPVNIPDAFKSVGLDVSVWMSSGSLSSDSQRKSIKDHIDNGNSLLGVHKVEGQKDKHAVEIVGYEADSSGNVKSYKVYDPADCNKEPISYPASEFTYTFGVKAKAK